MQKLLTDLDAIAGLHTDRASENEAFRDFLKRQPDDVVDGLVASIAGDVESGIDCLACGNCCRTLLINIDDDAIERIAGRLGMTVDEFRQRHVQEGAFWQLMNAVPCAFLNGKACTVYDIRPSACRDFPDLERPGFSGRLFATLHHYGMCPIIFNTVERLKYMTGFLNGENPTQ